MSGTLGVTETAWPQESTLIAGNFHAIKEETIKSGEGALVRGQVLARDEGTDKLVKLVKETAVLAEAAVVDAGGSLKVFHVFLTNPQVVPGTVTVHATVGAAAKTATDTNGDGKLSGDSGNIKGFVDYASGYAYLSFATAPDDNTDITVDYSHGNSSRKHLPVALLVEDVDATSADKEAQVYLVGEYRAVDLVWPSGISAGNKTRALEQLQAQGIVTK